MSPDPSSLRGLREDTIDDLCRRFAADELSLAELERRLEKARAATTRDELNALVADLAPDRAAPKGASRTGSGTVTTTDPPARSPARAPTPGGYPRRRRSATVPEAARDARPSAPGIPPVRPSSHLAFAVMGGTRRAGRWSPPSTMAAVALMGGVELDFRGATFTGGVVEINCFAFWGGVEIIVPPNVHVDTHGFAIMGGFEQMAELQTDPGPDAPTIRINGLALMGAVEIRVAEVGERIDRDGSGT